MYNYNAPLSPCLSRGCSVLGWWGGAKGVRAEWHREDLLRHRETNRCPHVELWPGRRAMETSRDPQAMNLWFWMNMISLSVANCLHWRNKYICFMTGNTWLLKQEETVCFVLHYFLTADTFGARGSVSMSWDEGYIRRSSFSLLAHAF